MEDVFSRTPLEIRAIRRELNMNDLISRAALFNSLTNVKTLEEAFAAIQNAPEVDAISREEYAHDKAIWMRRALE